MDEQIYVEVFNYTFLSQLFFCFKIINSIFLECNQIKKQINENNIKTKLSSIIKHYLGVYNRHFCKEQEKTPSLPERYPQPLFDKFFKSIICIILKVNLQNSSYFHFFSSTTIKQNSFTKIASKQLRLLLIGLDEKSKKSAMIFQLQLLNNAIQDTIKDPISLSSNSDILEFLNKVKFTSNKQITSKGIKKTSTSILSENEEMEFQEAERLRQLVILHKKQECGSQRLMFRQVIDEPVFLLWGSCVLDLRLSKDLSYQKDAGWNQFMKMECAEIFDDYLSFSMDQLKHPLRDMQPIIQILQKYNLQKFKDLSDSLIIYQQITNFMIKSLIEIKQQYVGHEDQLESILKDRQQQYEELKEKVIRQKEEEGITFIAITSGLDYFQDQTSFKHATISKQFLNLMGITPQQYVQISMRKGGMEFFEPFDQTEYVKSILDLAIQRAKKTQFEARIKTYDNIDLYITIESEVFFIDEGQYTQFTGDNILTIQTYILTQNQLKTLYSIRKRQIINPLIEWQEDFMYSVQSETLIEKFYQGQSQILKKMKKLNRIYDNKKKQGKQKEDEEDTFL